MIVLVFKECFLIDGLIPIAGAKKDIGEFQSQFTDHCFKIVASMTIENNELMDPMPIEYLDNIPQYSQLSARIHIHVEFDIKLPGVDAKRDGRKHNYLCSLIPGELTSGRRDAFG